MTAEEMRRIKQEYGLTYEMIAKESGVPLSTVSKMLMGVTKAPRRATVQELTSYFENVRAGRGRTEREKRPSETASGLYAIPETDSACSRETSPAYGMERQSRQDGHPVTIAEREALPEDRRTELIDGVLYDMSAPGMVHQEITFCIQRTLDDCIIESGSACIAYAAPVDIVPSENPATVLQPDVLVICPQDENGHRRKLSILANKYYGAPELAVEVLSPSTKRRDLMVKLQKYLEAGVREYWVVDPRKQKVIVYDFDAIRDEDSDDDYIHLYGFDGKVPVGISGGKCSVDFAAIAERFE